MRKRIALPETLSDTELLPHLICSPPVGGGGGFDEAGEHGGGFPVAKSVSWLP
jgi:hypothetical protein